MLGLMKACLWGSDRSKRKKLFEEWLEDAELRMKITKVNDSANKKNMLLYWGGSEFRKFVED